MRTPLLPHSIEDVQVDVREQRRDHPALRRAGDRPRPLALFHNPRFEPLPQELQHPPVRDPSCYEPQQLRLIDAAEVVADVGIEHVVAASGTHHPQRLQCLCGTSLRPKPVRRGAEVRLEDRLQHQRRRHLHNPISHRRDAKWPPAAIGLRDVTPQNRLRTIPACAQHRAELVQHPPDPVLLDLGQGLTIHPGRAAVASDAPPRLLEDVTPPDPVHQGVETPLRGSLGRDP